MLETMGINSFYKFPIQPYGWIDQSHNINEDIISLRDDLFSFLPFYMIYSSVAMSLSHIEFPEDREQLDSEFNELLLYYKGRSAVINTKNKGLMICDFIPIKNNYGMFGEPTRITAIDRHTGEHIEENIPEDRFVIIRSNKFWYPANYTVMSFCKTIANIQNAVDNNINQQKFPIVFQGTKEQKETLKQAIAQIEKDYPYIIIDKQINVNDITKLLIDAKFISKDMLDVADRKKSTLLELLGVTNTNTVKQSGISPDEVNSNNTLTQLIGSVAIKEKEKACKEIKQKFDIDCKVVVNDVLTEQENAISNMFKIDKGVE